MDWRCAKIDGDTITINKKDLEEARDHYQKISDRYDADNILAFYYAGKSDALTEMLIQFEILKG